MQVEINTVYTEETILKAIRFSMDKKKRMGVFLAITTSLVAFCFLIVAVFGELDSTVWTCLIASVVLDLLWAFMFFIYPRIYVIVFTQHSKISDIQPTNSLYHMYEKH